MVFFLLAIPKMIQAVQNPWVKYPLIIIGLALFAAIILGISFVVYKIYKWKTSDYTTPEGAASGMRWWHLTAHRR